MQRIPLIKYQYYTKEQFTVSSTSIFSEIRKITEILTKGNLYGPRNESKP